MPKKRYAGYRVAYEKRTNGKREAEVFAEELKSEHGGWTTIHPLALNRCPGDPKTGYTMDHAHARYDGEEICDCCGGYL